MDSRKRYHEFSENAQPVDSRRITALVERANEMEERAARAEKLLEPRFTVELEYQLGCREVRVKHTLPAKDQVEALSVVIPAVGREHNLSMAPSLITVRWAKSRQESTE